MSKHCYHLKQESVLNGINHKIYTYIRYIQEPLGFKPNPFHFIIIMPACIII